MDHDSKQSAPEWRIRWETPDGMYTFATVSAGGRPLSLSEVTAHAERAVKEEPKRYKRVAAVFPEQ